MTVMRPLEGQRQPYGPLKLVHVLLAIAYFSTGFSKIVYGGLQWMNGYTLQSYIFMDATTVEKFHWVSGWHSSMHCLYIAVYLYYSV